MAHKKRALDQIEHCFKKAIKRSANVFESNWPTSNSEIPESNFLLHLGCELLSRSHECYTEIQTDDNSQHHFDLVGIGHNPKWILVTEAKFVWQGNTARKVGKDWDRLRRRQVTSWLLDDVSGYDRYGALLVMTSRKYIGDWWAGRAESSRPAGLRTDEPWKELRKAIRQADRIGWRGFKRAAEPGVPMAIMYAIFELKKRRR